MLNWDDYRFVLAIARAGGLAGAAKMLNVTLSTVYRRLERAEAMLAVRLFDRFKSGYVATDAGREIVAAAERMEQEAHAADRTVSGQDTRLTGSVRITASEMFATCFLARHLPAFQREHPGVEIEIFVDSRRLSLADREADLTVRVRRPKEPSLFGRRVGEMRWGLYAGRETVARLAAVSNLSDLRSELFTGWDGSLPSQEVARVLSRLFPEIRYLCRSTSLITNAAVAASSVAIAPLPCLLGELTEGLSPIRKPLDGLSAEIWILTHEDIRRNARVRALMDYLADAAASDAELLSGGP